MVMEHETTLRVPCIPLSATHCIAVFRVETLIKRAKDPRVKDHSDPDTVEMMAFRNSVQRGFTGGKKNNVPNYEGFLEDIRPEAMGGSARPGFAPTINLYHEGQLPYSGDWKPAIPCFLELDESVEFMAFDGETQLAARHDLFRRNIDEAKNRGDLELIKTIRNEPVAVMIFHGLPVEFPSQGFFDANQLRVKVSATIALRNDSVTPSVIAAKELIRKSPILFGRVEMDSPTLRTKDNRNIVTLSSLHIATRAFFLGHEHAVSKKEISRELVNANGDDYQRWFIGVTNRFSEAFLDRTGTVLSNQTAWVAIGSTGHLHIGNVDSGLKTLEDVDWSRGQHWVDIAMNKEGRSANTHRHWKATFDALAKPESPLYKKVRNIE